MLISVICLLQYSSGYSMLKHDLLTRGEVDPDLPHGAEDDQKVKPPPGPVAAWLADLEHLEVHETS